MTLMLLLGFPWPIVALFVLGLMMLAMAGLGHAYGRGLSSRPVEITDEMVEACARAYYGIDLNSIPGPTWDELNSLIKNEYRKTARIVLAATFGRETPANVDPSATMP